MAAMLSIAHSRRSPGARRHIWSRVVTRVQARVMGMLRTELTVATPMKPKANQGTPFPALASDPFVFWPMPR